MKLTRADLPKLWFPLAAMLAMIAIALGLAESSRRDAESARQSRDQAATSRTQIDQRLRQVRTEEQDIKTRAQLVLRLKQSGIVGDERRLDWMELLRDTQRELRLPGMKYEFGPQTAIDGPTGGNPAWYASTLNIRLRLLHEEDLLNFLSRIQQEAKALVIVRNCKLAPLSNAGDPREALAQLGAECEMQWLTVRATQRP